MHISKLIVDYMHDLYFYFVVIQQCFSDGEFRLANQTTSFDLFGSTTVTGRLEVCYNFTYGSVCDRDFEDVDALVFCQNYFGTSSVSK